MANFKIEVPEEKLAFVIELFNQFSFIKYQEAEPTEIQTHETGPSDNASHIKASTSTKGDELKALRDTINRLQNNRSEAIETDNTALFRFPHGTEEGAVSISTYNHLISTIENYYRTTVTQLKFIPNPEDKHYNMDTFLVMILLSDKTELKAGYCSKNLS